MVLTPHFFILAMNAFRCSSEGRSALPKCELYMQFGGTMAAGHRGIVYRAEITNGSGRPRWRDNRLGGILNDLQPASACNRHDLVHLACRACVVDDADRPLVITASIRRSSMFKVSGRASTKPGTAASSMKVLAVDTKMEVRSRVGAGSSKSCESCGLSSYGFLPAPVDYELYPVCLTGLQSSTPQRVAICST